MTTPPPPPPRAPVLFLVFNRPDVTERVFDAIRAVRPPRLYVAADGPRPGHDGEAERVAQTRAIATAVDWPCEVKTLFRDENLGCKMAVSGAITWFFEQEDRGIILEDDCLPHPSFFDYCEWCLEEFKDNAEVWHINGNNFAANSSLYNGNIDFVSLPQVWGWASWADRWERYQPNPFYISDKSTSRKTRRWRISRIARLNKLAHLDALKRGLDTWDYQWQITVLNANGLAVSNRSNLISNLGDGPLATHTKNDARAHLPTSAASSPNGAVPKLNTRLTRLYESRMGLASTKGAFKKWINLIMRRGKKTAKGILRFVIFARCKPIIVASSGRSGSTMLTNAIAEAFVDQKFRYWPRPVRKLALRLSVEFVGRVGECINGIPVIKTHDLHNATSMSGLKKVFVFGPALDAVVSAKEFAKKQSPAWLEQHIYHLHGKGYPDQIFDEDVLNYEVQLATWLAVSDAFHVHYDDLWDRYEELAGYLELPLSLPDRRERMPSTAPNSYNSTLFRRLKAIECDCRKSSRTVIG